MFAYCLNNPVKYIDLQGFVCADAFSDAPGMEDDNPLNDARGGGFWGTFLQSLEDATKGLSMAMGQRNMLSSERHHVLSNKSTKYTPQYKEITYRYNMELNARENIVNMDGHRGRHTNAYHDFVLEGLTNLDSIAKGDQQLFYEGFRVLAAYVQEHPQLPYARKG